MENLKNEIGSEELDNSLTREKGLRIYSLNVAYTTPEQYRYSEQRET